MRYLTVSTNGLVKLPRDDFQDTAVAITLFGGGPLDDAIRGWTSSGKCMSGLFEQALENYESDPRVGFIYGVIEDGIQYVDDTVRRIADNGNHVTFNYYCNYDCEQTVDYTRRDELLMELLAVRDKYPEAVTSHPYFIRTLITGESDGVRFGYDVCPSVSVNHPDNRDRRNNSNPTLPFFNTYAADQSTIKLCCTSGQCDICRDCQAIQSWLLVSRDRFLESGEQMRTWIELAESYWAQFVWSRYHRHNRKALGSAKRIGRSTDRPSTEVRM